MCKKIVEYHGGRIWIDTEHTGGTRFCFTLPALPDEESDVLAALVQEVQRLLAVADDVQLVADLVVLEGLTGHQLVARVVLDQEDVDGFCGGHAGAPSRSVSAGACSSDSSSGRAGSVKQNRVPPVCSVSIQILPPWYSTIFLHTARPMPVPV
ncbi:hypothetical protein AIIKEEIJ_05600 [Rhodococcus sp. YH1]|nr:hypothetical protein [Rhodococcus sp. YH1]